MAALNFPTSPSLNDTYTANGSTWKWNGTSWVSYNAITNVPYEICFNIDGTLSEGEGETRWYITSSRTISNIIATVSTAPTGNSIIFDINKNGTTIFSTQANRPTIAIDSFYDFTSTPNITSLEEGDYLSIDVDQVGSTEPGRDALIRILLT